MIQLTTYLVVSILFIHKSFKTLGISFLARREKPISWLRNFVFLMFAILVTFVVVKTVFEADIGDYLIGSLISLIIYATSFNVIKASDFFQESVSDPLHPKKKYEKSALQEEDKARILTELRQCMEADKDFRNPLISQPFIAKKLNRPVHHISQVINEKLDQSFFEMIASYRVEEAKMILKDPSHGQLTIEDIADEVGYNSKSAFNRSFKKHTGVTPSEFRNQP
jgi:AraC-like DNA-binding protein